MNMENIIQIQKQTNVKSRNKYCGVSGLQCMRVVDGKVDSIKHFSPEEQSPLAVRI